MSVSPISHAIGFGLIAWFYVTARQVDTGKHYSHTIGVLTAAFVGWVSISTTLALVDFYFQHNAHFLPIVLGAIGPMAVLLFAYQTSSKLRGLIATFLAGISRRQLAAIHIVRLLAVGTIYKMLIGQLPIHFVGASGVPDFLIGASAVYIAVKADVLSDRAFIVWNLLGIAVFGVALVTMQLSLPGPLYMITQGPTTQEVLSFPMSLVPTFIAPFFIALHLLAIAKVQAQPLMLQSRAAPPQPGSHVESPELVNTAQT